MSFITCSNCGGLGLVKNPDRENDMIVCPDCEGSGKFCSLCKEPSDFCTCYDNFGCVEDRKQKSNRRFEDEI